MTLRASANGTAATWPVTAGLTLLPQMVSSAAYGALDDKAHRGPDDHGNIDVVSRWRMLDAWDRDLPGLTDAQLWERHQLAVDRERDSDAPGKGRNPKARRDWRQKRESAEAELARRGLMS